MWIGAAEPVGQDAQTAIILGIIGLLTAVLVAVATGVFTLLSAKANRTTSSPPGPKDVPNVADVAFLRERVAVLERRADDSDEMLELQDRRLDHIERAKDRDHPGWRNL